MNEYNIVIRPLVTEQECALRTSERIFLRVNKKANKVQIRSASSGCTMKVTDDADGQCQGQAASSRPQPRQDAGLEKGGRCAASGLSH